MRVVLDSNIYISSLISGKSALGHIQALVRNPNVQIDYSDSILSEVLRVLRRKFRWSEDKLLRAATLITTSGRRVEPSSTVNVVKADPDDDRIIECAIEASAHFIITGDRDLLSLRSVNGIRIVTMSEFAAIAGHDT